MKILWVKAGGLVPPNTGGRIRSYNILKHLARRHEVTFFTFYREHAGDTHATLEQFFNRVVRVPLRLPASRSTSEAFFYVRNIFSSRPYAIAKFCRPLAAARLLSLLQEEPFDVIVCDFVNAGGVIPWNVSCPKVLFAHNVEAQIWRRHFKNARNPVWKAVSWREYHAMDKVEQAYLRSADHVLAVSEVDRKHFSRFVDPSKITVVPTGVDIDLFRPSECPAKENILVFTGSMDWIPNEDGILYFLEAIFPHIQHRIPDVRLRVVGRSPSARLRALAKQRKEIQITGQVEDVRPYIRDATAYIVPVRIGGGTRLKIFEAMAMGKAGVSTAVGAEGLPIEHQKNILVADQPEDFANRVVTLLRDPLYRENMGRSARRLVEREHSWAKVARDFENALTNVTGSRLKQSTECTDLSSSKSVVV